jgi:hypothetical protein
VQVIEARLIEVFLVVPGRSRNDEKMQKCGHDSGAWEERQAPGLGSDCVGPVQLSWLSLRPEGERCIDAARDRTINRRHNTIAVNAADNAHTSDRTGRGRSDRSLLPGPEPGASRMV